MIDLDANDPLPPEMPAFDDANRPILHEPPAVYQERERTRRRAGDDFYIQLAQFLANLTDGLDALRAGQRVLILAQCCSKTGCETDAELAARLNMTPARVSQIRRELVPFVGRLAGCNGRRRFSSPYL